MENVYNIEKSGIIEMYVGILYKEEKILCIYNSKISKRKFFSIKTYCIVSKTLICFFVFLWSIFIIQEMEL